MKDDYNELKEKLEKKHEAKIKKNNKRMI